jgi:hypothetical protein
VDYRGKVFGVKGN